MTRDRLPGTVVIFALIIGLVVLAPLGGAVHRSTAQEPVGPVSITWPVQERPVPGPNVLVVWEASEVSIESEAEDSDLPRAVLIVDGAHQVVAGEPIPRRDGIVRATENPAVLPDLPPGEHSVQLVVTDPDGVPLQGLDQPVVTFTVLEPHPAQLYRGTCDDLVEEPSFELNDVGSGVPDPEAADGDEENGESAEPLPIGSMSFHLVEVGETRLDVPLADLLAEPHAISVRESAEEPEQVIACGDIGGPAFQGTVRVGLAEQDDSGHTGVATLREEGDRTEILLELTHEPLDDEGTETPTATPDATVTAAPGATATSTVAATATATMTATAVEPTATETSVPSPTATPCPVGQRGCPTATPDIRRVPTGIVLNPTATNTPSIPDELLTPIIQP